MEKDFGSWIHDPNSERQSPNLSVSSPYNLRQQSTVPAYMNRFGNTVSANGTSPMFEFTGVPHSKASDPNEPRGWFYCLPRYRQALAPVPSSALKEKPANPNENCKGTATVDADSGGPKKRFLVFDQSGDQTTLIFSSEAGTPVQCPSWNSKLPCAYDLNKNSRTKIDMTYSCGEFLTDKNGGEIPKEDVGSEMHEDTDELDALLYSDDDTDYSEDEEETSTGHSPSTMTAYDKQELFEECDEEVDTSAWPIKRQKLLDGGYDVPSLMDTASSVKHNRCFVDKDDAESNCGSRKDQIFGNSGSLAGNRRSRTQKIRETVSILKTIIPGGKGKDAIVVLDEAIDYLRSLKLKAKALGLDTLR